MDYDIDKLVEELDLENNFIVNRGNGFFLSNNQISILEKNNFNYKDYDNLSSLIFALEDSMIYDDELDEIIEQLSEINYYYNTKK